MGKNKLLAHPLSERVGVLHGELRNDRMLLNSSCHLYLMGTYIIRNEQNNDKKWQGLQMNTYEEALIVIKAGEINISSTIQIHEQEAKITYFLKLSDDWTFIEFRIIGTGVKEQVIRQETEGVKFVDFEITPLTNALPVNYLRYHQHQHLDEKFLLIQYPYLQSEYHWQRYFLSDSVVDYQNVTSNFQSRIMLDEDGFVKEYPGLFKQV